MYFTVPHYILLSRTKPVSRLLYFVACCICLLTTIRSSAQPPDLKFRYISKEQGLSSSMVQCIYQDSQGFIWIGTNDGLNKYDGYKITTYQHDTGSNNISNSNVLVICEDSKHNIWVGTGNGLNRFNKNSNNFTRYGPKPGQPNFIKANTVNSICENRQGQLWIGTSAGLQLLDTAGHYYSYPKYPQGNLAVLRSESVTCLYIDPKDNFWVGTDGAGLYLFDPQKGMATVFVKGRDNKIQAATTIGSNYISILAES